MVGGRPQYRDKSAGFTIIELLLATAIFSAVIVVALASFLGVSRLFYKGVTTTQTQQTARHILDVVSSDIQSASTPVQVKSTTDGRSYTCIGSARYIYKLNNPVNLGDHNDTEKFGLLRDSLPGNSSCLNPYVDDGGGVLPPSNAVELLGNGMILSSLEISPFGNSTTYTLKIKLATGDDDLSTPEATCDSNLAASQNCAITELSTTVSEGI